MKIYILILACLFGCNVLGPNTCNVELTNRQLVDQIGLFLVEHGELLTDGGKTMSVSFKISDGDTVLSLYAGHQMIKEFYIGCELYKASKINIYSNRNMSIDSLYKINRVVKTLDNKSIENEKPSDTPPETIDLYTVYYRYNRGVLEKIGQ